jgi:hypothetical protein
MTLRILWSFSVEIHGWMVRTFDPGSSPGRTLSLYLHMFTSAARMVDQRPSGWSPLRLSDSDFGQNWKPGTREIPYSFWVSTNHRQSSHYRPLRNQLSSICTGGHVEITWIMWTGTTRTRTQDPFILGLNRSFPGDLSSFKICPMGNLKCSRFTLLVDLRVKIWHCVNVESMWFLRGVCSRCRLTGENCQILSVFFPYILADFIHIRWEPAWLFYRQIISNHGLQGWIWSIMVILSAPPLCHHVDRNSQERRHCFSVD